MNHFQRRGTRGSVFREKMEKDSVFTLVAAASTQKKEFTYETPSLTPTGLVWNILNSRALFYCACHNAEAKALVTRLGLDHQHGRGCIVLEHHGRLDVM